MLQQKYVESPVWSALWHGQNFKTATDLVASRAASMDATTVHLQLFFDGLRFVR